MKRASIWGAAICGVGTLLTQIACSSLHGEVSLILALPWFAVFFPLWLCYRMFALDWRVGEVGNITFPMLLAAIVLNSFLGALLGAALWNVWHFTQRLFTNLLGYAERRFGRPSFLFPSPVSEQSSEPYQGPRCVSCNQPIAFGITFCPKCGYTQPA